MVSGLHQRRLLAVAILLVISVYDFARPTDIDLWWHLKTGEIIATTHSIPVSDPFSNPAHGYPWTVHEWLWDLVIYSLFRRGGYRLLVLVSGAVVSLTYGIVYHLLRRLGTNEFVAAALVIWAAWLGLPNFGVRPRELTLLFLALYLNRLFLYQSGQVRRLWLLPLLMLVWVNIHGGFILGLGVAGIFVLGALWEKLICRGSLDSHLLMVSLAVLAACCLNPTGPRILAYSVGYYLQGNNPSFATVSEFQSPDFHDPLYLAFAASLLALMLLGRHSETREAKDNPERTRTYRTGLRTVTEGLLLIAFALQALISVRQVAVFALVAAPLLAIRLTSRYRLACALAPVRPVPKLVALNWFLLCALIALGYGQARRPENTARLQLGLQPSVRNFPVQGAGFIKRSNLPDPVFNSQPWGGYLIYRWSPGRRVFIDGRVDMFGPAIVKDYTDVVCLRPRWHEVLDHYGIRTIIIEKDSALSAMLRVQGEWKTAFEGDIETVFLRR